MQTNQVPMRRGRPSIQQGLIFGVIVGVLFAIDTILGNVANVGAAAGIISILLFLVELFLYAVAGFRASAQTGRVGTGTLAGLFTGLTGGIIGFIVTVIVAITNINVLRQRSQATANALHLHVQYTNSFVLSGVVIGALLGIALAIGLGAAFGAIGGAIGRRRSPQAQVPYQEQFYQGMPPAPMNPSAPYPYNQGYQQANPNYPPDGQIYPQNQPYPPNNQENPYPYNQPPQPNLANPSEPYAQEYPPTPPSEDRQ